MFKRKIWDKFTEFTFFLKFWNLPSEKILKSPEWNEGICASWLITCDKLSKSTQGYELHKWQSFNINKFRKRNVTK